MGLYVHLWVTCKGPATKLNTDATVSGRSTHVRYQEPEGELSGFSSTIHQTHGPIAVDLKKGELVDGNQIVTRDNDSSGHKRSPRHEP